MIAKALLRGMLLGLTTVLCSCIPTIVAVDHDDAVAPGRVLDVAFELNWVANPQIDPYLAVQLPDGFSVLDLRQRGAEAIPVLRSTPAALANLVVETGHHVEAFQPGPGSVAPGGNTATFEMTVRASSAVGLHQIKFLFFGVQQPAGSFVAPNAGGASFAALTGNSVITVEVLAPSAEPPAAWESLPTAPDVQLRHVADLNGDGHEDLIGLDHDGRVVSLLGDGADGWTAVLAPLGWTLGANPLFGDFDGDGFVDLVSQRANGPMIPGGPTNQQESFSKGNGDGTFAAHVFLAPVSPGPSPMVLRQAVDLNDDGIQDVVGQIPFVGALLCYLGSPTGLTPVTTPLIPPSLPTGFVVADLDGDGSIEAIRSKPIGGGGSMIEIFSGLSAGTTVAATAQILSPTAVPSYPLRAVDLDGDGRKDLAAGGYNSAALRIFRNTSASGPYLTAVPTPTSAGGNALPAFDDRVHFVDVDADGILDMVGVTVEGDFYNGSRVVRFWRGEGDLQLTLTARPEWETGLPGDHLALDRPHVLASIDANGDDQRELVLGNLAGHGVTELLRPTFVFLDPCRAGNVGIALGDPDTNLLVNGSDGEDDRTVFADLGQPLVLDVTAPVLNAGASPFVVWGMMGVPGEDDHFFTGLGTFCIKAPGYSTNPDLFLLADSNFPGLALLQATPAPWSFTYLPGFPMPIDFALTGAIRDETAPLGFSVMNTVQVKVR
ncbi:MAG: VCBS repeat-containing protein [Planctomycetota bacterium]